MIRIDGRSPTEGNPEGLSYEVSFPSLKEIENIEISSYGVSSLDLSALETVETISNVWFGGSTLTALHIPALKEFNNIYLSNQTQLTTITPPASIDLTDKSVGIDLRGCNLSQNEVDKLLDFAVTSNMNTGAILIHDQQTSAEPSAQGLEDKDILLGRGVVVYQAISQNW